MWIKFKSWLHLITCPHKVCMTITIDYKERYALKQCVCFEKKIYEDID